MMGIRGDSYGSVNEVLAFTRHLLDGQTTFNSTTRPTITEIEKFIDRASGVLNSAIASNGFAPATISANSTAKLACDDWVTIRASDYTELTQRGTGYSDGEASRTAAFRSLYDEAANFVRSLAGGWSNLGLTRSVKMSDGFTFTGLDAEEQRADPSDNTLEQPKFKRNLFDNPDVETESTEDQ